MKYQLLESGRGVLIDRTPILRDIRDTYEVSFLMPDEGAYVALFKGADSVEYRKAIKDDACKIPKELLTKDQYVEVIVCKIDGDKVLQAYTCEPLRVTAFLNLRKTQWQLSGGLTDKDCLDRLIELESLYAQTLDGIAKLKETLTVHGESLIVLDALKKQNKELAENYNKAIEVINDLSKRLKSLEKNYDPTVID